MACTDKKLKMIYGDGTLGIGGSVGEKEFHYLFSYGEGGPVSFCIQGREWLYQPPRPTFWRASTDNDRGNGFAAKSSPWLSADLFLTCVQITVAVDGTEIPLPIAPENNKYSNAETAQEAEITYTYQTMFQPETTVQVSYQVNSQGEILVNARYHGKKGLPQLPVFGMRLIMPTCADKFVYEGLSGETYPDRKAGGVRGVYEVEGLPVTPYLWPQDCGVHMDTGWLMVYRSSSLSNCREEKIQRALRFEMDNLAFSCLPYTACELENAAHQEELPPARRTVLCIYAAVRGVGGIDSWGADVEPAYHVSGEEDIDCSFRICIP